jgi:hypothetical protein
MHLLPAQKQENQGMTCCLKILRAGTVVQRPDSVMQLYRVEPNHRHHQNQQQNVQQQQFQDFQVPLFPLYLHSLALPRPKSDAI